MKAGVVPGDVIMSVAGQPASDERDLIRKVSDMSPGKTIELRLMHQKQEKAITLTLGELPAPRTGTRSNSERQEPARDGDKANMGLVLMPADKLGLAAQGVVVADLDPGGVAAE